MNEQWALILQELQDVRDQIEVYTITITYNPELSAHRRLRLLATLRADKRKWQLDSEEEMDIIIPSGQSHKQVQNTLFLNTNLVQLEKAKATVYNTNKVSEHTQWLLPVTVIQL